MSGTTSVISSASTTIRRAVLDIVSLTEKLKLEELLRNNDPIHPAVVATVYRPDSETGNVVCVDRLSIFFVDNTAKNYFSCASSLMSYMTADTADTRSPDQSHRFRLPGAFPDVSDTEPSESSSCVDFSLTIPTQEKPADGPTPSLNETAEDSYLHVADVVAGNRAQNYQGKVAYAFQEDGTRQAFEKLTAHLNKLAERIAREDGRMAQVSGDFVPETIRTLSKQLEDYIIKKREGLLVANAKSRIDDESGGEETEVESRRSLARLESHISVLSRMIAILKTYKGRQDAV
jgi:hypothetical protein